MNEENKRRDDLEISFLGLHVRGTVKALVSLLNGTLAFAALAAVFAWHEIKSDATLQTIRDAIWFQTVTLATPQEARAALIKENTHKMPELVRGKAQDLK